VGERKPSQLFKSLEIADGAFEIRVGLFLAATHDGREDVAERVTAGHATFVLTLESEILPIKGLALVGPLPAEYQGYVSFSAGVSANAANPAPAQALVQLLASPANAAVYKAKGLEPRKAAH
jgi:molybdate transport system substrate-binding protein